MIFQKTRFSKKTLLIFFIITIGLTIVGFGRLAADINEPFGNFLDVHNIIAGEYFVWKETPNWWLDMIPNLPTEELLEIDGLPYNSQNAKLSFRLAQDNGKDAVTLTFNKHHPQTLQIPIVQFSVNHYFDYTTPFLILITCVLLGALAIIQTPTLTDFNIAIFFLCCAIAINLAGIRSSLWWHDGFISRFMDILTILTHAMIGICLARIIRLFPQDIYKIPKPRYSLLEKLIFILVTLGGIVWIFSRGLLWSGGSPRLIFLLDKFGYYSITYINTLILPLLAVIKLAWSIFHHNESKIPVKMSTLLLIGFILTLPQTLLSLFHGLGFTQFYKLFWGNVDWRFLILILAEVFLAITLKYHSLGKSPFEPLMLGIIISGSGLFARIFTNISISIANLDFYFFNTLFYFLFLAIALLSGLLWGHIFAQKGFFNSLLHSNKLSLNNVEEFIKELFQHTDSSQAYQTLVTTMSSILQTNLIGLWVRTGNDQTRYRLVASSEQNRFLQDHITITDVQSKPFIIDHYSENPVMLNLISGQEKDLYFIPISQNQDKFGFFVVESSRDKDYFSSDDIQTIDLMTKIAHLYLIVNYQLRVQKNTIDIVSHAQYHERQRIRTAIHDTTLQEFTQMQLKLSLAQSKIMKKPEDAERSIDQLRYDLDSTSNQLRKIIDDLKIEKETEVDLRQEIINILDIVHSRNPQLEPDLQMDDSISIKLNVEQKVILLSVIKRAVDNVVYHAKASKLLIKIFETNEAIQFIIEDNGQGFTNGDLLKAQENHHFGLPLMKTNIEELLNGDFIYQSTPGKGTSIQGKFLPEAFLANLL